MRPHQKDRSSRKKKEDKKKCFSCIARSWQSYIYVHAWRSDTVIWGLKTTDRHWFNVCVAKFGFAICWIKIKRLNCYYKRWITIDAYIWSFKRMIACFFYFITIIDEKRNNLSFLVELCCFPVQCLNHSSTKKEKLFRFSSHLSLFFIV